MSVKLLIFPLDLKESLDGWSILGIHNLKCIVPLPSGLQTFCKSADGFMGAVAFLLATFNISSLIFVILKSQCILVWSSLG